jgi:hypothetical protein
MSYLCIVAGRKRREPRVLHPTVEEAILEATRLREIPENLDRTTWIAQIVATLPAEVTGREFRRIRE